VAQLVSQKLSATLSLYTTLHCNNSHSMQIATMSVQLMKLCEIGVVSFFQN